MVKGLTKEKTGDTKKCQKWKNRAMLGEKGEKREKLNRNKWPKKVTQLRKKVTQKKKI